MPKLATCYCGKTKHKESYECQDCRNIRFEMDKMREKKNLPFRGRGFKGEDKKLFEIYTHGWLL